VVSAPRPASRVAELDGFRGIGCFLVLVVHTWPSQTFFAWGMMEMFFVLSGFLITGILLRTDLRRPIGLRNFLVRRILRIWPVYFTALGLAIALWLYKLHADPARWAGVTWWPDFVFLQFTNGYLGASNWDVHYAPWFRMSWSLAVEEQFYVVWPLALILMRGRRGPMFAFCLALLVISVTMRALDYPLNLLLTRADGFALGATLAMLQESVDAHPQLRARANRISWLLIGLASLAIVPYIVVGVATGAVDNYGQIGSYGNWTVLVLAYSALFFGLFGLMRNGQLTGLKAFLSFGLFTWLGEVSYAIYMYQGTTRTFVYDLLEPVGSLPPLLIHLLGILACVAMGPLSAWLIENRFERIKRRFPVIVRNEHDPVPAPLFGGTPSPAAGVGAIAWPRPRR
jgi:peptidoglycan/LPS O-acetylase OafA/YrhL